MGSDGLQNLPRWKNAVTLARDYTFYIYLRPGHPVVNPLQAKLAIVEAPLLDISSTHIRETIKSGKSIRFLVPDKVREEIELYHYYS